MSVDNPILQQALQYHQDQQFKPALKSYLQYLLNNSNDFQVWYLSGKTCCQLKQYDEALQYTQRAISINPQSAQYQLLLAEIFEAQHKPDSVVLSTLKQSNIYPIHPKG